MSTSKPFRIIAAIDLDDTARATWAAATALLANPRAELSLIHVVRASDRDVRRETADVSTMVGEAHQRVQELLAKELGDESNPLRERIEIFVGIGNPADEIVQLAVDVEASLIVVGTHERGDLARVVLGSVSTEVFRRAPCSVLVARLADYAHHEKTRAVEPPLAEGQPSMVRAAGLIRYRSQPFSTYSANLFPTGIPRKLVR